MTPQAAAVDDPDPTVDVTALELDRREVQISVGNPMLAEALSSAARRERWTQVPVRRSGGVLVSDRTPRPAEGREAARGVVLVSDPTPFGSQRALGAIVGFQAVAIVCSDRPSDLAVALEGLRTGRASVPLRVLDLAARMPTLTDRQLAVLRAAMAGQSNAEIGRGLYLSTASVKRELAALYAGLGAVGRPNLVAQAHELGVRPWAVRP